MSPTNATTGFTIPLLLASLLLNLYFFSSLLLPGKLLEPPQLGWSRRAAETAEAVAGISCSGHGRVFLDGVLSGDGSTPVCECNTCYVGDDCSELDLDCPADVDSGDPLFLEPYWRQHASQSAVMIAGWHRMSYKANGDNFLSIELEKHIRLLHSHVGNAIADDKFIVFGVGSTQLTNAIVSSLSYYSKPAKVVATAPYYPIYELQTELFDLKEYDWQGVTSNWTSISNSSTSHFIEFVTSPNNPDGQLKKPVIQGSHVINDHAYYWPHFTPISYPADEDIMMFTMSKASGHAGSRFGWVLIRNETLYNKVVRYVTLNSMGVSRETHLRTLMVMKAIISEKRGGQGDIFRFGYETMKRRWEMLNELLSTTKLVSLQPLAPYYCTYFNTTRYLTPAYGWLKCKMKLEEGEDCRQVLRDSGVITREGSLFGDGKRHTRLSLIKSEDDFQLLLKKLKKFISITERGVDVS